MSDAEPEFNHKEILGKNRMLNQELIRENERLMQKLKDMGVDIKDGADFSIEHPFNSKMFFSQRRN